MFRLLLALTFFFGLALPAAAQDAECSSDAYAEMADLIVVLAQDVRLGEADVLEALRAEITHFQAQCAGLSFEGEAAQVLGPVTIPEGTYRAVVATEGFFAAQIEVLDGTCSGGTMNLLFNLFQGQGNGAEALVRSQGCTALLEVKNVTDSWSLVFERLG